MELAGILTIPLATELSSYAPRPPESDPRPGRAGGAIPPGPAIYLRRPQDDGLQAALGRRDSIVLIKGAKQMGKTSLLARGLEQARARGANVVFTDFQLLSGADLQSPASLYLTLAESITEQLALSVSPRGRWDERRGPNVNFERYLRREVLSKLQAPLVWGLDQVDRLFASTFGSEVFGLFRSWHNERALDPSGPWSGLTLAVAYATEAHLFITDMNQSPFNVGTRLALEDFSSEQVAELNRRYGEPLRSSDELRRLGQIVGGHPYLVGLALQRLAEPGFGMAELEAEAGREEGVFGKHLRGIGDFLSRDARLTEVMRAILSGQLGLSSDSFYRLRSAGLVSGSCPADVRTRCPMDAAYLKRRLT